MDRRQFLTAAGTAGAVGLAGCLGGIGGGGGEDTVTIGLQADLTGAFANIGYWHDRVVNGYVSELQDGDGIAGKDVEVVVKDTETDSRQGVSAFRELAQQEDVDFVISSQNSGITIGSIPVAKETGTPYFSIAQAPSITGTDGNRWTLRAAQDVVQMAIPSVQYGLDELGSKWTVLFQDYAFGQQFNAELRNRVSAGGGEVLRSIPVQLGTTDLTSQLNNVPEDTEVLFGAVVPPTSISFLKQSIDLDIPGERLGPIQSVETVDVSELPPAAAGATFISPMPRRVAEMDTEAYRHLDQVADAGNADTPRLSHFVWSYEAVSWIKAAIEDSGWNSSDDNESFIEWFEDGPSAQQGTAYPQGSKSFRGVDHQAFVPMYLERIRDGELRLLETFEPDGPAHEPRADLASQSF